MSHRILVLKNDIGLLVYGKVVMLTKCSGYFDKQNIDNGIFYRYQKDITSSNFQWFGKYCKTKLSGYLITKSIKRRLKTD